MNSYRAVLGQLSITGMRPTISPCQTSIFLIKDFYGGEREGIEESNQNGD